MFACKACEVRQGEIDYLRDLVKRLSASQNPGMLFEANPESATGYYGDGNDDLIEYDDFGAQIVVSERDKQEQ